MTVPAPEPVGAPTSLLSRVLEPAAPRALRLAAARGALPLSRQDLILALVRLRSDADADVASESAKSLRSTSPDILQDILRDPRTDIGVLDHFARAGETPVELLTAVIVNPSASDEILLRLADSADAGVLDQLLANETRLVKTPAIAEKLKANPALSRDARRRLGELEEHVLGHAEITFDSGARTAPGTSVAEPPPGVELPPPGSIPAGGGAVTPMLEVPLTPEEQAAEEALRRTPLYQRIIRMNVADKIQAAIKGNAEERAILIRDPSRIVSATVLKSPKLNEQEIENFANLRNINDEVLRIIGTHRDWTKAYGIAYALSRNPRTPTGISLTMLNRLTNRDLKNLGTDKNIPEVIRRSAKRLFDLRTKPPEKGKRK